MFNAYFNVKGATTGIDDRFRQSVTEYLCPPDPTPAAGNKGILSGWGGWDGAAAGNYAVNYLVFGASGSAAPSTTTDLNGKPNLRQSFRDGTGTTVLVTERYQLCFSSPDADGLPHRHLSHTGRGL